MPMTLIKKVALGAAGLAGFIVAVALLTIVSSLVSALIPGRSPDAPGKLDESIEERAKREHKATLTNKQEPKTDESHNETVVQQEAHPEPIEPTVAPQEAAPASSPAPAPVSIAPPAPPARGPGNFDAPPAPYGGGGYQSGPGNM